MRLFNLLKSLARPRRLHNWYNLNATDTGRPTTANVPSDNYGGIRKFLATSDMADRPDNSDGHIIQLDWDNSGVWASQLFIPNGAANPKFREQLNSPDWSSGTRWYTFLSEKNTADYVVEIGTSGNWRYRKWESGTAECWGSFSQVSGNWNAWGVIYEAANTFQQNYPSGLFNDTPFITATHESKWGGGLLGLEIYDGNSKTTTPRIVMLRPSSAASDMTVWINIYAVGRWK